MLFCAALSLLLPLVDVRYLMMGVSHATMAILRLVGAVYDNSIAAGGFCRLRMNLAFLTEPAVSYGRNSPRSDTAGIWTVSQLPEPGRSIQITL